MSPAARLRIVMESLLPITSKIIKSMIAPARHSSGPTLYVICESEDPSKCNIYEQLPDGECVLWPESPFNGRGHAEAAIYRARAVS